MKKSEYKKIVMQQAGQIQKLNVENIKLKEKFENAREFLMIEITKIMGEK